MSRNRDDISKNRIHFHGDTEENGNSFLEELDKDMSFGERERPRRDKKLHREEGVSVAEFRENERQHEKHVNPIVVLAIIWVLLAIASLIIVFPIDSKNFSVAWAIEQIRKNTASIYNLVFSAGGASGIEISLIKIAAVFFIGGALATCGSLMQGSYRNVIAGPSTTGVMAGGTLGCVVYLLLFTSSTTELTFSASGFDADAYANQTIWDLYGYQFCVLGGCILGTALILVISRIAGKGKMSPSAMLIAGMVFSSVISSVNMVIQYYMIIVNPDDTRIEQIRDMMMGSFDKITTLSGLLMLSVPLTICFIITLKIRTKLNLLSMGDDEAQVAGMNVQRYRMMMMLLSAVMTALVVAFCGRIGFVGFMVPLVTRRIVGPDMKKIVPCSILVGAILLTVIYDLTTYLSMTDSVNVITSAIGCIVMVVTLLRRKGGGQNAVNQRPGAMRMGIR